MLGGPTPFLLVVIVLCKVCKVCGSNNVYAGYDLSTYLCFEHFLVYIEEIH